MAAAEHVFYNDGTDEDVYALVIQDNGNSNYNLWTPAGVVNDVPRREKKDYDAAGGGHTWHSA